MKHANVIIALLIVFSMVLSGCSVIDISEIKNTNTNTVSFSGNGELKTFKSIDDIEEFMEQNSGSSSYYGGVYYRLDSSTKSMAVSESAIAMDVDSASGSAVAVYAPNSDYSETNVQVEGVDEADIVKTDGEYIYYVANNIIYIIEADGTKVVSEISNEGMYPSEIFVNGDKLVVIGWQSTPIETDDVVDEKMAAISSIMPYPRYSSNSFVKIFDISDKEDPEVEEDITLDGGYFSSRMIGDNVYIIFNQGFYSPFVPPVIYYTGGSVRIEADSIRYFDMPDDSYQLSIILAVDLTDNSFTQESIVKGYSQNIFVSENSIYLTNQKYIPYYVEQKRIIEEVMMKKLPADVVSEIEKIQDYDLRESTKMTEIQYVIEKYVYSLSADERSSLEKEMSDASEKISREVQKEREKTIINKILIDGKDIEFVGKAEVKGYVLNQFSMDEYDGNFRIATTTGNSWDDNNPSVNHIFIFDSDMKKVGSIEDIAPKERIYSVRFMGERAYMVTFQNVDPLFVIDLSDATAPKILGKLKIPGYSNYLHPFDENHIIGIGKETEADKETDRFYLEGLKMSLFDVTDVEHPIEMSKVEIGDRGTDSDALYDHRAFLFDREKELLVIPVRVAEIDTKKYKTEDELKWAYGDYTFQGAYVYKINLDGFELLGRITHIEDDTMEKSGWYYYSEGSINRALYIGNTLYTLSNTNIMANDLSDLSEISSAVLKEKTEYDEVPIYY
ncbi:beta-propeller domain-containing protein [Candidatus Woesearchaeota archaeon]|nr:beta-propeller domain-containing protein [Candidatus Woesearchaeota archaeon]